MSDIIKNAQYFNTLAQSSVTISDKEINSVMRVILERIEKRAKQGFFSTRYVYYLAPDETVPKANKIINKIVSELENSGFTTVLGPLPFNLGTEFNISW